MPSDIEIERKFEIPDEETLIRIREEAQSGTIPGIRIETSSGPHCRFDIYHDTASRAFLADRAPLRMSIGDRGIEPGGAEITWKTPTDRAIARRERAEQYSLETATLMLAGRAHGELIDAARDAAGGDSLGPVLRVTKLYWVFTGRGWECAYGYVTLAGSRGVVEDLDLEVELKRGGDEQRLLKVVRNLRERYVLKERTISKYEAGMREVG